MPAAKNVPRLPSRFTVRVYAFILDDNSRLLISREHIGGMAITKLPGGGVEFGEGPNDALKRELTEELGVKVARLKHFYTVDHFVQSALDPEEQVIGIYYLAELASAIEKFPVKKSDFRGQENTITHEWISLENFDPDDLTFEMDRAAFSEAAGVPANQDFS